MSDLSSIIGQHEARLDAHQHDIDGQRSDTKEMFRMLRAISEDVAVIKDRPQCSDPNACVKLRDSMVDQNRRLTTLELKDAEILGAKTIVVGSCVFVGWAINALIAWFHKS